MHIVDKIQPQCQRLMSCTVGMAGILKIVGRFGAGC